MAAPVSDRPDDHQTGETRAFDRSSLEQSLAEVLRSAERAAAPPAPSAPQEVAPPAPRSDPFRPADLGRPAVTTVNHVGLRRNGPPPTPAADGTPAPASDPTPPPPAVIPASLRLLVAPPAEPPPAADVTDAPTADGPQTGPADAVAALVPWRPEDDDILPARRTRRRHRR